jgi:hypothetical protein
MHPTSVTLSLHDSIKKGKAMKPQEVTDLREDVVADFQNVTQ